MRKLEEVIAEHMKDPEFKKEWDVLEPEFRMIRERLKAENKTRESLETRQSENEIFAGYAV